MMSDRKGEMGFAEAMLAVITVSVVLMMYIGSVSTAVQIDSDPLEGIEPDLMTAEVSDGRLVFRAQDYLEEFYRTSEVRGLAVSVQVPGGFAPVESILRFTYGEPEGMMSSMTFSRQVPADFGRTVVAVYGVTAWY